MQTRYLVNKNRTLLSVLGLIAFVSIGTSQDIQHSLSTGLLAYRISNVKTSLGFPFGSYPTDYSEHKSLQYDVRVNKIRLGIQCVYNNISHKKDEYRGVSRVDYVTGSFIRQEQLHLSLKGGYVMTNQRLQISTHGVVSLFVKGFRNVQYVSEYCKLSGLKCFGPPSSSPEGLQGSIEVDIRYQIYEGVFLSLVNEVKVFGRMNNDLIGYPKYDQYQYFQTMLSLGYVWGG